MLKMNNITNCNLAVILCGCESFDDMLKYRKGAKLFIAKNKK